VNPSRLPPPTGAAACLSALDLYDYRTGVLEPDREAVVVEHLRRCPECRRRLDEEGDDLLDTAAREAVRERLDPGETERISRVCRDLETRIRAEGESP